MTEDLARYVHGTEPVEQERLSRLNALLNAEAIRELALRGGEKILDVGSGLGQLTRDMARAAGTVVVGIEKSAEQRAEAKRQADLAGEARLIEMRAGDALDFPLRESEWGTFDVVHTRFVLEHVTDPAAVVHQMVRAARPGGRLVLQDDDHALLHLWPEPPGVMAVWRAYVRTYDRLGCDPFIGRRLVQLLHEAGAGPVRARWLFFGACSGEPAFPAYVENLARILEGARDLILATNGVTREEHEFGVRSLREWGLRPDGAFWYALAWAEGKKPDC